MPNTLTLKMANEMPVETLEKLQLSTQCIPESRTYTFTFEYIKHRSRKLTLCDCFSTRSQCARRWCGCVRDSPFLRLQQGWRNLSKPWTRCGLLCTTSRSNRTSTLAGSKLGWTQATCRLWKQANWWTTTRLNLTRQRTT